MLASVLCRVVADRGIGNGSLLLCAFAAFALVAPCDTKPGRSGQIQLKPTRELATATSGVREKPSS